MKRVSTTLIYLLLQSSSDKAVKMRRVLQRRLLAYV
jgi:hypothetical protein